MHAAFSASGHPHAPFLLRVGRVGLLVLPVTLLAVCSLRATGTVRNLLWLGTLFQGLACLLALIGRRGWSEAVGPVAIMLYVIALSWVLLGGTGLDDWFL